MVLLHAKYFENAIVHMVLLHAVNFENAKVPMTLNFEKKSLATSEDTQPLIRCAFNVTHVMITLIQGRGGPLNPTQMRFKAPMTC